MKIKEGFKLRSLGREFIVTAEGVSQVNFNKMVSMNESAAYLYKSVAGQEFTAETLRDLLLERYSVSEEVAARDAEKLAQDWISSGIAEE